MNGQERCDYIFKKIKHFNIKHKSGKNVKGINFIGPPSGVYGGYWVMFSDGTAQSMYSDKFIPNADDINRYFPGYKKISRKRNLKA